MILGNGFDLSCKRQTSYSDFRSYLINKYGVDENKEITFAPDTAISPNGDVDYDKSNLAEWYVKLIDNSEDIAEINKWSKYEEILGYLDYDSVLDNDMNDYGDDDDEWIQAYNNEDMCTNIFNSVLFAHNLFSDWIYYIQKKPAEINAKCNQLLSYPNTYFLNFNYTDTLEKYVGIKSSNITHIHGYANDNDNLIVGHHKFQKYNHESDPSKSKLNELDEDLEKNVTNIIKENSPFFDSLHDITEIYFFGFSFGEVDLPYIEKIFEYTSNPTCYLNCFNPEDLKAQREILTQRLGLDINKIKTYQV